MKLKEHIYAIRGLITKGPASDDTAYSLRFIAHMLNVVRAILTEQKADKYTYISEQSYQSLCVNLELGSFHNCCEITDVDCKVLKSVDPIPKFLNARWGDFAKVMTLTGDVISKTSPTMNKYSEYTLTNSPAKTGWFIHDNHLYIVNNKFVSTVLLNCLFDDPIQILELNCSNSEDATCPDWYDEEYPIDPDLIQPAYLLVVNMLLNARNFPPNDTTNDAQDSQVS